MNVNLPTITNQQSYKPFLATNPIEHVIDDYP